MSWFPKVSTQLYFGISHFRFVFLSPHCFPLGSVDQQFPAVFTVFTTISLVSILDSLFLFLFWSLGQVRDKLVLQAAPKQGRTFQTNSTLFLPSKVRELTMAWFLLTASPHWGRNQLLFLAILWNSAFRCLYLSFSPLFFASLLFTAICKPPQTAILLFCISFLWGWSLFLSPVQCHEPLSIVHQALYLSDLGP